MNEHFKEMKDEFYKELLNVTGEMPKTDTRVVGVMNRKVVGNNEGTV